MCCRNKIYLLVNKLWLCLVDKTLSWWGKCVHRIFHWFCFDRPYSDESFFMLYWCVKDIVCDDGSRAIGRGCHPGRMCWYWQALHNEHCWTISFSLKKKKSTQNRHQICWAQCLLVWLLVVLMVLFLFCFFFTKKTFILQSVVDVWWYLCLNTFLQCELCVCVRER